MSKIRTYFGFKNGQLVSVLQSVNGDVKKAVDCTYYITEPQEMEKREVRIRINSIVTSPHDIWIKP